MVSKSRLLYWCFLAMLFPYLTYGQQNSFYKLIAHRGGIVQEDSPENSLSALKKAINQDYYMVEVDMRITKDSVLITHHDRDFIKYFGLDRKVGEMDWEEIRALKGANGHSVLTLEEVLKICQGKIQVMLDNKISGYDEGLFNHVFQLLKKYHLDREALMIGTTASTDFFRGKIKLSCTRKQLEENLLRPDYDPDHYYLFSKDINREDVIWAEEKGIMAVGEVNTWTFSSENWMDEAKRATDRLRSAGLQYFQIDSVFEGFFEE